MKINRILFIPAACLALSLTTVSCDSEGDDNVQWWDWGTVQEDPEAPSEPEEPVDTEANPEIVALGWTNQTAALAEQYGEIPEYIQVYKSPATLCDKNAYAYIAVADFAQVTLDVLGDAESLKTPSTRYEESLAPIVVNGGFFYQTSLSLIVRDGQLICPNTQVDSPDWSETYYYMPRGTFSILQDGTVDVSWVYTQTEWYGGKTYAYPIPMPLENGRVPEANYPEGGKEYTGKTGIGGGPVLTKGGTIINSWEDEFLNINPEDNRPRTAIGYNPTANRLVLFACAGDNTESVSGLTLENTANVLLALGCTESVNLDGGGSTVMLFNGNEIIKPSGGEQRTVGSCAAFK